MTPPARGRAVMMVAVARRSCSWRATFDWHGYPAALALQYPQGVYRPHAQEQQDTDLKRLNRIEGQVRGLARMVEDERYCIDIVTQIGAVRAALRRVEEEILRDHVAHCVAHAIASGDKADQRRKVAELMDVMGRASR